MNFEEIDWHTWQPKDRATLVFVIRQDQVLLIHKKRGLGAGKINGPGGRIDPGESAADCARRELFEEVGLTAGTLALQGQLLFQFADGYGIHVHVYLTADFSGTAIETEEALPIWTPLDQIPYERMWADDRLWLPHMLAGNLFRGEFLFSGDAMLGYRICFE